MTGEIFQEWLQEAILQMATEDEREVEVETFEDAGLLTGNLGLVVYIDGESFQVQLNGQYR